MAGTFWPTVTKPRHTQPDPRTCKHGWLKCIPVPWPSRHSQNVERNWASRHNAMLYQHFETKLHERLAALLLLAELASMAWGIVSESMLLGLPVFWGSCSLSPIFIIIYLLYCHQLWFNLLYNKCFCSVMAHFKHKTLNLVASSSVQQVPYSWLEPTSVKSVGAVEYTDCFSTPKKPPSVLNDTKQSDGEVPVILELWGMQRSTLAGSGSHW